MILFQGRSFQQTIMASEDKKKVEIKEDSDPLKFEFTIRDQTYKVGRLTK